MEIKLENESLELTINSFGAELKSITGKETGCLLYTSYSCRYHEWYFGIAYTCQGGKCAVSRLA